MPVPRQASTLYDSLLGAARPGRAKRSRASGAAALRPCPPVLEGGANGQADETDGLVRSVKLDWLNYTGPVVLLEKVRTYLEETCGLGPVDERRRGGNYYQTGVHWGTIGLYWSPSKGAEGTFLLSIPASGLEVIRETIELNQLCRWLSNGGCKPTRVDIALDLMGPEGTVDFCHAFLASCEAGELVGAKCVKPLMEFNPRDGELRGLSIAVGKRGNLGSGRSAIAYDKGLEQGTHPPCTWQRYEVRFMDDHAPLLASDLAADLPEHCLAHHAYGAYDFLENNGKRKRDRPRVQWWADFVEGQRITTTKPKRVKPTLAGVAKWIDRSVVPAMRTYAVAAGMSVDEFLAKVVGTHTPKPSRNAVYTQSFREWCAHKGVSRRVALDRIRKAEESAPVLAMAPLLMELLGLGDALREEVPI